jgi:hypothetical protein
MSWTRRLTSGARGAHDLAVSFLSLDLHAEEPERSSQCLCKIVWIPSACGRHGTKLRPSVRSPNEMERTKDLRFMAANDGFKRRRISKHKTNGFKRWCYTLSAECSAELHALSRAWYVGSRRIWELVSLELRPFRVDTKDQPGSLFKTVFH